ncbi:vWA domain-containing protein [Bogoriella caseilytica]|uniref:von Willebrand factor type A domain-containing protein n=1 Tax=Bogoriella caseilytica TaxID=56055 RepID=A0A3N2BCA1_9MICO|nr:VWA domain-containing protein [Bogoriella caseilytica]ROR72694.1 von Willebrand factor type A domain-containing protein [Bogoriella caseilytica]
MVTPWLWPLLILGVIAAGSLGYQLRRVAAQREVTYVANSAYLTELPEYRRRMGLLRGGLTVAGVCLVVVVVAASVLASRPVDRDLRNEELASRDIVLCLDVSGSMIEFGSQTAEALIDIVDHFEGERIALSIWNNASRLVFPLTDDYDMVQEELAYAAEALDFDPTSFIYDPDDYERLIHYLAGTVNYAILDGSLIGDGLANCIFEFDVADQERSRSVIFLTDNVAMGESTFALEEVYELASERDITIHGLYAAADEYATEATRAEFERLTLEHGGLFVEALNPASVAPVVEAIEEEQTVALEGNPTVVETDQPQRWFPWLPLGLAGFLLVVWRLRA